MNQEAQRIAIAKACGWKDIGPCSRRTLKPNPDGALLRGTLDPVSANYGRDYQLLPDYFNDLNAMHEAEWVIHQKELSQPYYYRIKQSMGVRRDCQTLHATAAQRAEAFLKTLNLWID